MVFKELMVRCSVFFGKRRGLWAIPLLFLLFGVASGAPQGDREGLYAEVERILNGHTAFSWGKDCIVWMVAYPESLVEPWVDLRALEEGFSEEEKRAYRASFRRDLRLHDTEPVLLTFYVFGDTPLSFAPFADHIALVNSSNTLVSPLSYAENLDDPITGIVQGFVFFPPQEDPFSIQVQGMAPGGPRRFVFPGMGEGGSLASEEGGEEVLVVRLPEKTPSSEAPRSSSQEPLPTPAREPTPKPTPIPLPTEDPDKPPPYLVLPPGSSGLLSPPPEIPRENFLQEEPLEGETFSGSEILAPENWEEVPQELSPDSREEDLPLPINRVRRVDAFLQAWKEGDGDSMYGMLSLKSRENISQEAFTEAVLEDQFRFALKNPYTLKWEGENTVKVVAPQKMLVMRVLRSKTLRLVLERGAWYIAW
jgi:hypothetical protein